MDREYAQLMALENQGICTPRELLSDALLIKMREVKNTNKSKRILNAQERREFDEELNRQMKNMPPYWYTEEQAEEWYKKLNGNNSNKLKYEENEKKYKC